MIGLNSLAKKIFGTQNDRELKLIQPLVVKVNQLEASIAALDNARLQAKTGEFKERIAKGESLDSLLPEAFAVTREASKRVLGMRHFDVQLIGGATLHRGRISEMKTGEGKTLVATLPVYLNALEGKGVHVITVNDYLARRDSEWMGQLYGFLGLQTGVIVHGLTDKQRKLNYGTDITYGTNNEFGFDYLRDNMKYRLEDYVQRELNFAIVDEVDSILIDEARTPLIISGPSEDSTDLYYKIDRQITAEGGLKVEEDYTVDEKSKTAALTEKGVEKMEGRLGIANLYDPVNIEVLHHVNQALRAHVLFKVDVDYVVRDGQVLIVDEFTGRLMPGRRWSDGLHQAIEAKEGVEIESENQTLATITFQNYFRMYKKLAGMTGTADTEAAEFKKIYNLDVTVIPTNRVINRVDQPDLIYKTETGKFQAILEEVKKIHARGQPILLGTSSVDKSEVLSRLLKQAGITHNVLNAKQHEREAEIIAQAGRKGALTIATNMAGRGTDILLGGNAELLAEREAGPKPGANATEEEKKAYEESHQEFRKKWLERCASEKAEILSLGGLFILGTERHDSRRIDNQLRGRAGRQGDPGGSRFYLSLEDGLMRIFGGVSIQKWMDDDMPLEHRLITKAIENAQKKVEGSHYDMRKHLLEYDDVMNQQRKVIYSLRRAVLSEDSLRDMVFSMVEELANAIAEDFFPGGKPAKVNGERVLNLKELNDAITVTFQIPSQVTEDHITPFNDQGLIALILKLANEAYDLKEKKMGAESLKAIERYILLETIDHLWKDHLLAMDHLREGIGLRGYGQKDPLVEYKKEAFRFFQMMMHQITGDVVRKIFAVQMVQQQEDLASRQPQQSMEYNVTSDGELVPSADLFPATPAQPAPAQSPLNLQHRRSSAGGLPMGATMNRPAPGGLAASGGDGSMILSGGGAPTRPVSHRDDKVGRNDPCPCGSGKKYKKCHGT